MTTARNILKKDSNEWSLSFKQNMLQNNMHQNATVLYHEDRAVKPNTKSKHRRASESKQWIEHMHPIWLPPRTPLQL